MERVSIEILEAGDGEASACSSLDLKAQRELQGFGRKLFYLIIFIAGIFTRIYQLARAHSLFR